jgi:hypothetical protein
VAVVERQQVVTARATTPDGAEAPLIFKVVKKPVASDIQVERRAGGSTYRVPAAGMLKGSKGLFLFAVIWNVFISFFLIALAAACFKNAQMKNFLPILFMLPFIAVGVGTMLWSVNMGRRKTAIVTAGDELLVISEGIFGKNTRRFNADALSSVHMGPSGMSVNDVPVMELQFHAGGGKFGVLSERSNDELEWLAVQVSLELGLLEVDYQPSIADEAAPTPWAQPH